MLSGTLSLYKNAFSGLSKPTWLLSLVILINRSGTMVVPFMTIYLTQPTMGYSIAQAGFVMGLFGLGAVCGGLIGGRLTDKFGFYPIQLITLCGGGIMFMILGQMKSFPFICLFTFLLSLVNEAFRPANSTAVAHFSKEQTRTRSFSLNRMAINLGWAFGGALGGLLASIDYHLLFWVDGCTNIIAAMLLRYFLSPGNNIATPAPNRTTTSSQQSAYKDRGYLAFLACTILFGICFFQLFTTMPVYFKQVLHLGEFGIGLLMTMSGVMIASVEMILVFSLEGRRSGLHYVSRGVFIVGIAFLLLNILPGAGLLAVFCMLVATFGEISSMPFMNSFWVARTSSNNRGQYAGLYTMAWSSAQVLGPSLGSQVAGHFSFRILWWATGCVCFVAAMGFRWLLGNK
ncbi:MAG TPA: MFS transporter [Puia sp.]|jgi:predicted MFS family arabinose efflux permease|nr:MFS transporter [Puia sp.]